MFEVGFTELLLIAALALLVLGPQKLPKLAQQVGRWVGRARAMARQFRDQLEEEAHTIETKMSIDPGIDTSLDGKPKADPAPATAATPAAADIPAEEDFYPPDHHMHPSNQAAQAATATDATATADVAATDDGAPATDGEATPPGGVSQGELDLTTTPEPPPKAT